MAKYSKTAEKTGSQSVLEADIETKKYAKILDTVMNERDFEKIWETASSNVKLNFIMNSLKYVFKEKGRETEADAANANAKLDEVKRKLQALNKLMNE